MVGVNAARGNGLMAELRQVLVERPMCRYREHAARTRAEQLDRIVWAEEARSEHPYRGRDSRDAGAAPVRWPRLI
jgi:hypothetical protein